MKRILHLMTAGALALCLVLSACGGGGSDSASPSDQQTHGQGTGNANVIQRENDKGAADGVTSDWKIALKDLAQHGEIEGYASAVSVNRGESISLFVNTADPSYDLTVYRVGWYGGAGARRVAGPFHRTGVQQPAPSIDAATGLVECHWTDPLVLQVPRNDADATDWASGVYLVKLVGSSGKQRYMIFTVRDDERHADLLMQNSVNTYQAYNFWGGHSLYSVGSVPESHQVSFDRPYDQQGAGPFLQWEIEMVRFLEKEGFDVSYTTDVDVDAAPQRLLDHKAFLVVGHDEYWTRSERDGVEAALAHGVHLGFFAANVGYWQVRTQPSPSTGQASRVIVGYKHECRSDPILATDPSLATCRWRDAPVSRPEAALVGVMFDDGAFGIDSDIVISQCPDWVCAGTPVSSGTVLKGLLGNEVDSVAPSSPVGLQVIAASPYTNVNGQSGTSNAVTYTAPSGAIVFSTGSMQWNWGLDDGGWHASRVNPAVQQMTRNVLRRFVQ